MAIFEVKELASYIANEYWKKYERDISPIKMQKSLYFLFAYWGGYVRKSKENSQFVEENISQNYSEYLFFSRIEAWVYGPVVPEVYHTNNIKNYSYDNISKEVYVREFVDDILNDIFVVSDFKLVDMSHLDLAWKNHFNKENTVHEEEIPKLEIIEEYARK